MYVILTMILATLAVWSVYSFWIKKDYEAPKTKGNKVKYVNSIGEQQKYLQERYKDKFFEAKNLEVDKNIGIRCPHDNDILFRHDAIMRNDIGMKNILRDVKCCDACNSVFLQLPDKIEEKFNIEDHCLYINKRIHDCQRNGHIVISATGIVEKIDGSALNINIQYCLVCRKYFIEKQQFDFYKSLYGIILGNFIYCDGLNDEYAPLMNQYSLLNLCGYNVNQKDNLSSDTRQSILRYVIENKLMSKADVIKHLDYYINLNSNQNTKKLAIKKWKDDLAYVSSFQIDKQAITDFRRC